MCVMTTNAYPTGSLDESGGLQTTNKKTSVPSGELIDLLADEYVCALLCALNSDPQPVDTLVEACSMSRPTAYRRLDRLTDAGIVDARINPMSDGHHKREFWIVHDSFEIQIDTDGVDGSLTHDM
ncbi:MAG: transcriptional regulator [Haloquadratum walsbyi J07HQW2]|jgi:Bacterial regulatory protein, arsR family.|uniref:Transcriptional regulator n=2 Tax=Haloquadratum walsbyi TaxID=293091 RepID=U1PWI4_9EURY|nr:MAG: transcriptional regulator [Haloquadratum walsbyi J07HQW2]